MSYQTDFLSHKLPTRMCCTDELYLHTNELTGVAPENICVLREDSGTLANYTTDCAEPKPQVTCTCCSECY